MPRATSNIVGDVEVERKSHEGATDSNSDFVTLISNDGFEFVVRREAAMVSGTIRRMLDPKNHSGFIETATNRVNFDGEDGLDAVILEKVCEYMYYSERNKNKQEVPDMDIPPELCLQLLIAADYLEL